MDFVAMCFYCTMTAEQGERDCWLSICKQESQMRQEFLCKRVSFDLSFGTRFPY